MVWIIISLKAVAVFFGSMLKLKALFAYLFSMIAMLVVLFFPYIAFEKEQEPTGNSVRVMTYSSFIQDWGAGPEIAKKFKQETGLDIHWINAGNAGLIIERLKFKKDTDQPDLILGLDQFSIYEARKFFDWVDLKKNRPLAKNSILPEGGYLYDFMAYDWGPLTFVYKKSKVSPPKKMDDLLDKKYRSSLILQDPRLSSPGLQFLLWVLADKGEKEGFEFLKRLKPNIKVMAPSWSSSYSIFKEEQPTMVFSYFTSPFYHLIEENNDQYEAVSLENPHPVQVEYAGIPQFCGNCDGARKLAQFLLRQDIQKILMRKNYMYPIDSRALQGEAFKIPQDIQYCRPIESVNLIKRKKELVNLWKKVFY